MAKKVLHKKYTNKELALIANKYSQRSIFRKNNPRAYAVAGKRGILRSICKHMGKPKNQPYTIEELIKEASKYKSRSEFERMNKKMYSAVINRNLGHIVFKNLPSLKRNPYTYEELLQIFSSCYSLTHFYHVYGKKTALAAQRMGVFDKLKKKFKKGVPPEYSSIEYIKQIAKTYPTFKKFKDNEHLAYLAAQRLNKLTEIELVLPKKTYYVKKRKPQKTFSLEHIIEVSSKYKTTKDFQINEPEIYAYAKKKQILLKALEKTMVFPKSKHSIQEIYDIAKKYETLGDFLKEKRHIYHMAKELGIFDNVTAHINRLVRKKYTNQELIDFAKKYQFREDVRTASSGVYSAIFENQLEHIAFNHMPPKKFGKMESAIREFVSEFVPCRKYRDNKVSIDTKKHIKRLEIDIFIPSLNKGIEFDGTYWHSPEILQKRRPHWPEKDILNYENIKDEYFKSKGIEILHVKETDWINNQSLCKEKILSFLGITS